MPDRIHSVDIASALGAGDATFGGDVDEAEEQRVAANKRTSRRLLMLAVAVHVAFTIIGLIGGRTFGEAARAEVVPFAVVLTMAVVTRLAR